VLAIVVWQAFEVRGKTARLGDQLHSVDEELPAMSDVVERRNEVETLSAELTRRVTLIDHHGRHSLTFSQQALRR